MNPIRFFVAGLPKPQPRPRAFARKFGDKWQARVYDASTAEGWKSLVANAARQYVPFPPLQGPIRCDITFWMPRPKSHFRSNGELKPNAPHWHISRGDRDNLDKAVLDALTQLGMWDDDSQVCCGEVSKRYGSAIGRPGAQITIEALEPQSNGKQTQPAGSQWHGLNLTKT